MSQFCVKTVKYFCFTISRCTLFTVIQSNAGAHRIERERAIYTNNSMQIDSFDALACYLSIDWRMEND